MTYQHRYNHSNYSNWIVMKSHHL